MAGLFVVGTNAQAQIQRSTINTSFEVPAISANCQGYVYANRVTGWKTTDPALTSPTADFGSACVQNPGAPQPAGQSTQIFEYYTNFVVDNQSGLRLQAAAGNQFVELNGQTAARLYQSICLIPNETVTYSFSHLGRRSATNPDVAALRVGGTATLGSGTLVMQASDTNSNTHQATASLGAATAVQGPTSGGSGRFWGNYSGSFQVPAGLGGVQQLAFEAVSTGGGSLSQGNFLDNISITVAPVIQISSATYSSLESNASPPSIQLTVVGVVPANLPVSLQVTGGTAALGADYTINGGSSASFTYNIPAGDYGSGQTFNIPVSIVKDTLPEGNETFTVALNAGSGYVISSTTACGAAAIASATYTIVDDDTRVTLAKVSNGGVGTFNFTLTGASPATDAITTTSVSTTATSATRHAGTAGTAVFITEANTAGFAVTGFTCTDANSAITGNTTAITGNTATITLPAANMKAGADYTCTYTNARPRIRLLKALPNGRVLDSALTRDQFTLTVSGPRDGVNTTATVTTTGIGNTAAGTADFNPGDAGGTYALSEAAGNATTLMGLYNSSISCSNATAGSSTALPSGSGTSFSLGPVAASDDITCTFNNPKQPSTTVTIRKTSLGSTGTFNFSGTNGIANQSITTATVGTPQAGATQTLTAGLTATTITEAAPPAGFILQSITCTGLGAGGTATPTINGANGGSVLLDASATAPGSNIVCTFTNTNQANLSITKTNNTTSTMSGTNTVYTIAVANNGPASATGAIVKDPAVPGLTCVDPVPCSGTSCPSATVPLATLQGSGVVMGTMNSGDSATFTLTCKVN